MDLRPKSWALILELDMMTGSPMGPMMGLFGVDYAWPQFFLLTFVAHVVQWDRCGIADPAFP